MEKFPHGLRKSTHSQDSNCIMVADADIATAGVVGVGDSKNPGHMLEFTPAAWQQFISNISAAA